MADYDDLDTYDGDPVHDGWVDFDYHVIGLPLCHCKENTGELSDIFDDTDLDQFIDNLNDWD